MLAGLPGGSEGKESPCNAGEIWSLGGEDPLEKGRATHSSILAWGIPWTEPGGLQYMGSKSIWYNWAINIYHFHSVD